MIDSHNYDLVAGELKYAVLLRDVSGGRPKKHKTYDIFHKSSTPPPWMSLLLSIVPTLFPDENDSLL